MNEIWEARRKKLENVVRISVLDLFEHMGSAQTLLLQLDPPEGKLFVVAGDVQGMLKIMPNQSLNSDPHPQADSGG